MFVKAMSHTVTENGMTTSNSSGSSLVDLFFTMGAARGLSDRELETLLEQSYNENPELTLKSVFYCRDIRGGMGERRAFRVFIKWLANNHPETFAPLVSQIPEFGRWDDLFVLFGTPVEVIVLNEINQGLVWNKSALCAKWMPREGKAHEDIYRSLLSFLGLTPRKYRKLLSSCTNVVETKMCKKEWSLINYEHVPSVASNKYRKAFLKNDPFRYGKFISDVTSGKAKINASAIFPNDIVHKVIYPYGMIGKDEAAALEAQWKALPDYVPAGMNFIPICDVSGSMSGLPMEVCLALGVYLSERSKSEFKDHFITFSSRPKFQKIVGANLVEKVRNLMKADWEMNTNLEAVFELILSQAKRFSLKNSDMPKALVILSDMQFDQCIREPNDTAYQMIKRMYKEAGYEIPQIIFWNLRASAGVPVKFDKRGTALVSGFSPSIMKSILSGKSTPMDTILNTILVERYERIKVY